MKTIAKLALPAVSVAVLLRILFIIRDVRSGDERPVDLVIGLIIGLAIVAITSLIYLRSLNDYKNVARKMSQSVPAWWGVVEYGKHYRIVSADDEYITLWKVSRGNPEQVDQWLKNDVSIEIGQVHLTSAKSYQGISITGSGEGNKIKLILYGQEKGILSRSIKGEELARIADKMRA